VREGIQVIDMLIIACTLYTDLSTQDQLATIASLSPGSQAVAQDANETSDSESFSVLFRY
jgi:hypothetical protein